MKTIEEKAKAYDEAIKRAKAMIKVAANQDEAIGFANTVFPELAESEDERIIKALKEGFNYHQLFNPTFGGIPCIEIVNWLEKQGDKDKLIKELGEYKVKYTQEVLNQQLEKQAKKKSQRMISAEAKEALYGKPAWSEEDDKMLIDAIGAVGAADYYTYDDKVEIERWLKLLKQRIER